MIELGQSYSEKNIITQELIRLFAQVSGDDNPIHLDNSAAKQQGFDGALAHGLLVGSFFSKILGTHFPGQGTVYLSQNFRFKKPVYPGHTFEFTVTAVKQEKRALTLETLVKDEAGVVVLEGEAVVLLPKRKTELIQLTL